jgi:hypothetical protein
MNFSPDFVIAVLGVLAVWGRIEHRFTALEEKIRELTDRVNQIEKGRG